MLFSGYIKTLKQSNMTYDKSKSIRAHSLSIKSCDQKALCHGLIVSYLFDIILIMMNLYNQ